MLKMGQLVLTHFAERVWVGSRSRRIIKVLHIAKLASVMARLFNQTMVHSQKIILEEKGKNFTNLLSITAVASSVVEKTF